MTGDNRDLKHTIKRDCITSTGLTERVIVQLSVTFTAREAQDLHEASLKSLWQHMLFKKYYILNKTHLMNYQSNNRLIDQTLKLSSKEQNTADSNRLKGKERGNATSV